MATHSLETRRKELDGAVAAATDRVLGNLQRYSTRGRVELAKFREMTIEEIYRTKLAPGGPRIWEFAERHSSCADPPDPDTPDHNYECVERRINRLLNTRLMRSMLTLGGHSDHGADGINWTDTLLKEFRRKELKALSNGLRGSSNTTGQTRDPPD